MVTSEQREQAAASVVAARLGLAPRTGDKSQWKTFADWAAEKGLPARPAAPAAVALWVLDSKHVGVDRILAVLESVSAVHAPGADPTLSPCVTAALNQVVPLAPPPPRSWSKTHKSRWPDLPYDLQREIAPREHARDLEIRRMQNELAQLKKENTNGRPPSATEPAAAVA